MSLVSADYASVEAVKQHLHFTETPDDDFIAQLIREASDLFSIETDRCFVPVTRSVDVEVPSATYNHLETPDILALSGVSIDGEAIALADYKAQPLNLFPKTWIKGAWRCGQTVTLDGTFGYHQQPSRMWRATGTALASDINDTAEIITLNIAGIPALIERLDYIKVGDEVMQVQSITVGESPVRTTLTVERGALDSVPAAHSETSIIQKYEVYAPVRLAIVLRVAHMYMTRKNPGVQLIAMPGGDINVEAREPRLVADTVKALRRTPFVRMERA